ncbi:aspartate kinase [Jeotgalibacillus salarius]|uniref:Aspartokinase n=1 Tax=Jeotgalibacillus salarius TaxID=546023 RepID=A0A4Y8LFY9_9BACL|nr:aspartate kinase [Jeotgalibacillus salarius]TFE00980.1 aspartate kinase [Jeotgalibacillus salarius]
MGIIVQKFGGTSVGSVEKIHHVANRVILEKEKGNDVIVVVSAMGKTTDELVRLAGEMTSRPEKREMDMLLTTGEQMSTSLLAMALQNRGYKSTSLTGWQAGIRTEPVFSNARITDVKTNRVTTLLDEGRVIVVAGFQGMDENGEITTLGRGGSDTTAVALAAALNAERCDIYTDVDGVYSTDPRYVKGARKLNGISYDEMLELANLGAGVLHPRAVEFAKNYGIKLTVRSSMEEIEGTLIEEDAPMEEHLVVRGVAFDKEIVRMTVVGLENELTGFPAVFSILAQNHIDVDIIIQSKLDTGKVNLSFSIKESSLEETLQILADYKEKIGYQEIEHETNLSKVSIVGSGMVSNPGVAAQMFSVLAEQKIQVKMVSTSEIKVSAVVDTDNMIKAANAIHESFGLNKHTVEV